MRRFLKGAGAGLGFLVYVWFAAVKYGDLVKKRKRCRSRFDVGH
jgi:hypothetical protein